MHAKTFIFACFSYFSIFFFKFLFLVFIFKKIVVELVQELFDEMLKAWYVFKLSKNKKFVKNIFCIRKVQSYLVNVLIFTMFFYVFDVCIF